MATAMDAPIPVLDVGFTILSNPQDAVIDIVFVHGLQGHPKDTWTYKMKSDRNPPAPGLSPSKVSQSDKARTFSIIHRFSKRRVPEPKLSEEVDVGQADDIGKGKPQGEQVFWPIDLLKDDFPKARIMTFGYNTHITQGYHAAHQGNIFSHAKDLLYGLAAKRRQAADRDLVCIAHSLGGILVKEVLRRSEDDPDAKIKDIFTSTAGVFFFGTPHRGSKDWASFGEGVVGVVSRLSGVDMNNQVIHALLPSGPELELCQESFTRQWVTRGSSLVVRTFQESKGVTGVRWGGLSQLIVPQDSSSLDHPSQRARTIDEDHRGMVKFKGRTDEAYQMVREDIEELVENIQTAKETRNAGTNMTEEDQKCVQHLRLTDPRHDKRRIEDTKGGLLDESYHWILENSDFQRWRDDQQSRLLWIKGDPGKGKTMLLCGIVNELEKSMAKTDFLSYFFCQATDPRINNAIAVLRGLIYLLVNQQPSLISHVRKKYDHAGKALFEDANAWVALREIFANILQDPSLTTKYLAVDALDECVTDLQQLLDFIAQQSSASSCVKWIVSGRNWQEIEERLAKVGPKVRLSLELNAESISMAVSVFIDHKVRQLAQEKKYKNETRESVQHHLSSNANGTFLWVALVCQSLQTVSRWKVVSALNAFPPGLDSLYRRMMDQICNSCDADFCKRILASIAIVYRPIKLVELGSLIELPEDMTDDLESLQEMIGLCGSFLTLREGIVYFVHQSAKDFLFEKAFKDIFPHGSEDAHYIIFSRSLQVLHSTLRRDMYNLSASGYTIEQVEPPDPDPLEASRYSCVYWVDHLCGCNPNSSVNHLVDLQDGGTIDRFLRKKYLYWLEALSLFKSISKGILSVGKLEALIQGTAHTPTLIELVRDAHRFILYHKGPIENAPLQVYVSALVFSPAGSVVRALYKDEEPKWITVKPDMGHKWSACLQTIEVYGHQSTVNLVVFSHDSTLLAAGFYNDKVMIWDASNGKCLQTLEGHTDRVNAMAFSHDSTRLALASSDRTIKIWDTSISECLRTLEGHSGSVCSVAYSHKSTRLASASLDRTVKIWNTSSSECLRTLEGYTYLSKNMVFSHNLTWLASGVAAAGDTTVKIWDISSGECLRIYKGHTGLVMAIAFSHDSTRLASASSDKTIKTWDTSNSECLHTFKGHASSVCSIAYSHKSTRLASGSDDTTIKVWDINSGECLQTLKDHPYGVSAIVFSHDSTRLASGSYLGAITIWDISGSEDFQTLEHHTDLVTTIVFSDDLTRLASGSYDMIVKIWDTNNCKCLQTLEGHNSSIRALAFSPNSKKLASASDTVKVWDTNNGECLQTLECRIERTVPVGFSYDLTRLASGMGDGAVKIWDINSGKCFQTLKGHSDEDEIRSVVFSNDSTRLASASQGKPVFESANIMQLSSDSKVKIWDVSSGKCLQTLKWYGFRLESTAFSHDLTRLASASRHNTVKIWDLSSGECLQTFETDRSLFDILSDPTGSYLYPRFSAREDWIICNPENSMWLPSEYRPQWSIVLEKMIVIGAGSGKVWMCRLNQV